MMRAVRLVWAWAALLLAAALAAAAPAAAQNFPKFTGLVVDAANVLPQATRDDLTRKLEALQKDTHRQLVVATIPSLQDYPLDEYGYKLGRAWGVGLRDVNNGIVLFVAPNEPKGQRGPRIEVGRGLEPIVTDALSSVIIRDDMLPKLKASNDVPGAMEAGTDALIRQLRASPDEAKARGDAAIAEFNKTHQRSGGGGGGIPIGIIFWLVIMGFVVASWLRRGRGDRYHRGGNWPIMLWGLASAFDGNRGGGGGWGGGGGGDGGGGDGGGGGGGGSDGSWGGGGFTGGGGGDFGGGGASGDW